jgi:predicted dehydrogenase
MRKSRVSFIGAGYMAEEHIKAFSDIDEVELVGIFSKTMIQAKNLATKYHLSNVCNSISDLYRSCNPDIVVVAVPELATMQVCEEIFKYSWISLIEKPVGFNLAQAEVIRRLAISNNHKAYVALNRRHYSSTRKLIKEVDSINEPRFIHVLDQENPIAAFEGGQPKVIVDNWMYANSIHIIDYFSILCRGDLQDIENIIPWAPNSSTHVLTKLQYSSGDVGLYQAVWNAPGPWSVVVTMPSNRYELRPLEVLHIQRYKSRNNDPQTVDHWDKKFKPGLRLQAEELISICKGKNGFLPTLDDGIKTMKVINLIYGS